MLKQEVLEYLLYKLKEEYPEDRFKVGDKDYLVVINGFMQYMKIIKNNPEKDIPLWSKSVDFVWHSFILHTKAYSEFCEGYFGKFVHHVPSSNHNKISWTEDLELREWFMSTMVDMGYNPFPDEDSDPYKAFPPIMLSDVLFPRSDSVKYFELAALCQQDYKKVKSKFKLRSFWKKNKIKTGYEGFVFNFNPFAYSDKLYERHVYPLRKEYIAYENKKQNSTESSSRSLLREEFPVSVTMLNTLGMIDYYGSSGQTSSGSPEVYHSPASITNPISTTNPISSASSCSSGNSSHSYSGHSNHSHSCGSSSCSSSSGCSSSSCSSSCGGGF